MNAQLLHGVRTRTQWLTPVVNASVYLANRSPLWLPRPLVQLPLRLCAGVIWLYVWQALAQDSPNPPPGAGAQRKEGVAPPGSEAETDPALRTLSTLKGNPVGLPPDAGNALKTRAALPCAP